jgi:hypothetical protein
MDRTVRHINLGILRKQLAALPVEWDELPVFVAAGTTVEACAGVESCILESDRGKCIMIVPTPPWDYR